MNSQDHMKPKNYRTRIYNHYQSAGQKSAAPTTVADLKPRAAIFRKIIREHFPDDFTANILDLGCGHGAFIYYLKESGFTNIIGVDTSPEQIAKAKILNLPEVIQGDLLEYLLYTVAESQDIVISFDIIEHFDKDELLEIVDQVFRVLKPKGKWIIHTPNGGSPFGGAVFFGDYTHEQSFTTKSISQLLKASGFASVECYEDVPIPHGLKSSIRWLLWQLIRVVLGVYFLVETGAGGSDLIFSQNFLTVAEK